MKPFEGKRNFFDHTDRQHQFDRYTDIASLEGLIEVPEGFTFDEVIEIHKEALNLTGEIAGTYLSRLAPAMDRLGFTYDPSTKQIIHPKEADEAYALFRDQGLVCLTTPGQYRDDMPAMPVVFHALYTEMASKGDQGAMMKILLSEGGAGLLNKTASAELKDIYLTKIASGEESCSMCLTEQNAGSSMKDLKTRATRDEEGRYWIQGEKIFISTADAENHIVLTRDTFGEREDGKPKLSLYLVPTMIDGKPNNVSVGRIEHKLGIHSSPTGSVNFDGAQGFMIYEEGMGMEGMLMLMYEARLGVAIQGLANIDNALTDALEYTEERSQGGRTINQYPMVAEKLAEAQVYSEGIRGLIHDVALATTFREGLEKRIETLEEQRATYKGRLLSPKEKTISDKVAQELEVTLEQFERYKSEVDLMVLVAKEFATERSVTITRDMLQAHGGAGFTTEHNVEKYFRDSIITTIYEGTSEIQALMFLGKTLKPLLKDKKGVRYLATPALRSWMDIPDVSYGSILRKIDEDLDTLPKHLAPLAKDIRKGMDDIVEVLHMMATPIVKDKIQSGITHATYKIKKSLGLNPEKPQGGLTDAQKDWLQLHPKRLIEMVGEVYCAYSLAKQAGIDHALGDEGSTKETKARHFNRLMRNRVGAYLDAVKRLDLDALADINAIVAEGN